MCVDSWSTPSQSLQAFKPSSLQAFKPSSLYLIRPCISSHRDPPPAAERMEPALDNRPLDVAVHELPIEVAHVRVCDRVRRGRHLAIDEFLERPHAAVRTRELGTQ